MLFVCFLLLFAHCRALEILNEIFQTGDPDVYRNISQMISSKGYPVEDHSVTTADGYILSVQHIPHGRDGPDDGLEGDRRAVLFVHGLLGSAVNFVFDFPEESLGFILADRGYDVWLANVRGTTYSMKHTKYSSKESNFWNFSFQEMAEYDLPALIDYVLEQTGQETLSYVGHSQGTLVAFALLSESPEYNRKINLLGALAPVAHLGNITQGTLRFLAHIIYLLGPVIPNREANGNGYLLFFLKELYCNFVLAPVCRVTFFELLGMDKQLNQTRDPVYLGHFPDSTSTKNLYHFSQLIESSKFRKFNYGKEGNMAHYNQATPPDYELTRITAPVALMWSQGDSLADPKDVDILRHSLANLVGDYKVPNDDFGHIDFVIALTAKTLVYDYLLSLLEKV